MFKHRFALPLVLLVFAAAFTMPLILNGENEAPAAVTSAVQTAENAVTAAPAPETPAAEAAAVEEEVTKEEKSRFAGTFWALVPPLLAIILALITKEVYSSLFIGVMLGGRDRKDE